MNRDADATEPTARPAERLSYRLALQYGAAIWVRLISFLAIVLVFPQVLPKQSVGLIIFALTVLEVVASVSDLGFSQLATVRLAGGDPAWRRSMAHGVWSRLGGTALLAAAATILWLRSNDTYWLGVLVVCGGLLPFVWIQNARAYWNGRHQVLRMLAAMGVAYTIGYGVSALGASAGWGPAAVLAALAASFWLEWLLIVRWCRPEPQYRRAPDCYRLFHLPSPSRFFGGLAAALPFGLFSIAWFVYLRLDILLLLYFGRERLAEYGIAIKFYSFALMLLQAGSLVILSDSRRLENALRRFPVPRPYLLIAAALAVMGILAYGPRALISILPASYTGLSVVTIRTLIVAGLLHGLALILGTLALGGRHKASRFLWVVFLAGGVLILFLAGVEQHFLGGPSFASNRLLTDLLIFGVVATLYWRRRAPARQQTPREPVPATAAAVVSGSLGPEAQGRLGRTCNWISYLGLVVIFLFAATIMAPVAYYPGRTKMIWLFAVFGSPWVPQLLRGRFWQSLIRPRFLPADYGLAVFLVATGFACLTSLDRGLSIKFIAGFVLTGVSVYALARYVLDTRGKIIALAVVWCVACGVLTTMGILEWYLGRYYVLRAFHFRWTNFVVDMTRPVSRMALFYLNGIPAAHMFLLLSACVGVAWGVRRYWRWALAAVLLGGTFASIWFTQTRGAILVVLSCVLLYAFLRRRGPALVLVVLLAVVARATYDYWPQRVQDLCRRGWREKNVRIRLENYLLAAHLMRERPWLGFGPRTLAFGGRQDQGIIPRRLRSYEPVLYRRKEAGVYRQAMKYARTLDNSLLTVGVEHGAIATLGLIAFFGALILGSLRSPRRMVNRPAWRGLAGSATMVLIASCLFSLNYDAHPFGYVNALHWMTAGLLAALGRDRLTEFDVS